LKGKDIPLRDRLIVSIDVSTKQQVIELCTKISGRVSTVKLGLELLYSQGFSVVDTVKSFGYKVMLDSKLYDIPNTVSGACRAIAFLKPWAVTIHTLGGPQMIGDAKKAISSASQNKGVFAPLLLGVTILTSLDDKDLEKMGFKNGYMDTVISLASIDFYIATPGIRLSSDSSNDQKRVATPQQAVADGADFLVVGRSITAKDDILGAIDVYLQILGGEF